MAKPDAKSGDEKRILETLAYVKEHHSNANVSQADGRLLRILAEAANAGHVVEIGTSTGYSGIWFCLALKRTGGKLTTYEIDTAVASTARENFARAGCEDVVTIVEGNAHDEVTKLATPIDILFLDADKSGYIDYLNKLLPLIRPGGLILAHNTKFPGVGDAYVEAISTNPELDTVFIDFSTAGIGVTLKKR